MLRWSVFPGTVGIIAPLILSPLLCFPYVSVYFNLWEPVGHCTSDSAPNAWRHGKLDYPRSVCTWGCVFLYGGAGFGRRWGLFLVKKLQVCSNNFLLSMVWNLKAVHDETPYPFSHYNTLFFCLYLMCSFILFKSIVSWLTFVSFVSLPIA